MRLLSAVLALAVSALPSPRTARADAIELTVRNDLRFERRGVPVICGVPLPKGYAHSLAELALGRAGGGRIPVQIEVSATYGDGSPRWVLLHFLADLPGGGSTIFRLERSTQAPQSSQRVSCALEDGVARVDTGRGRFTMGTRPFRLFDSVTVDATELTDNENEPGGIDIELADGSKLQVEDAETTVRFESTGPLCAKLCVRGCLRGEASAARLDFTCRYEFWAGNSAVRVSFSVTNPAAHRHPGNIWDLGSGGSVFLEDLSLVVPLRLDSPAARVAGSGDAEDVKLYQDSSGGPNWRSANHVDKDLKIPVSFRGYRVYQSGKEVASGDRIDGWAHARGRKGGLAASVREFWQNFPKTLEYSHGRLRVGLWPREFSGAHELLGGERKTHETFFLFHGPDVDDDAVRRRLRSFSRPVYPMPAPEAVFRTRAFLPTAELDREQYRRLEDTCDTAVDPRGGAPETIQTRWEVIDEFGWRHFGDTFADNERAPEAMMRDFPDHHPGGRPISHYVNEYDVIYAILLQGIRRGDPRWMWLADVCARHHADICVNHTDEDAPAYSRGPFMHTTHETAAYRSTFRTYPAEAKRYGLRYGRGGGPNAGHTYVASLVQHYLLTGNRASREAFLEVANWAADSPWFDRRMMGDQRGYGNLLMTFVYAYGLTGERKYHDRATTLLGWIDEPFAGLGGNLFVKAAGRFLDLKADRDEIDADYDSTRRLLMAFGEHYLELPERAWEGSLEQSAFHAEVLCTCFLHAPKDHPKREAFWKKGTSILDEACERFPGRYVPVKTWVMCFANTGAYLRARELGPP